MPPSPPAHALLAGGGSGGHVYPALAVADELTRRGWRVSFIGRAASFEQRVVERYGLEFHSYEARPIVGRGVGQRISALSALLRSIAHSRRTLAALGADVVLGTGGYVSAPAVLAAWTLRVPSVLLEPNATPGSANRWMSRFAREAVTAFSSAAGELHCPAQNTGVPVRGAFFATPRALPSGPIRLLVLGGSQGARQLNELVPAALEKVAPGVKSGFVLHQAGEKGLEPARKAYAGRDLRGIEVEVVAFIEDVASAMAASQLIVCRAGALTVSEIAAAARPALLVPLSLAGAHQVDNARELEAIGGGIYLEPGRQSVEELAVELGVLLADRARLEAMAARATELARRDAAARIADRLAFLVRRAA